MTADLAPAVPPLWRRIIAYAAVALMPVSINWGKLQTPPEKPFYISPLDFLLPLLAVLLLLDIFARRPWVRLRFPPVAVLPWIIWALASLFWVTQGSTKEFLVTWAKTPVFFGLVAVWVFANLATDAAELRRLTLILFGSIGVCLIIALKQYFGPVGLPFDPAQPLQDLGGASHIRVAGWYDFRGALGAQMALIIPAAAAFVLSDASVAVRLFAAFIAVAGLCVTLAAGGFIAAVAGTVAVIGVYASQRRDWTASLIALFALVGIVFAALPLLPRNNPEVLQRGLTLWVGPDGEKVPTARLRRYQAALDLLGAPANPYDPNSAANWKKGVGLGRYQRINQFYQDPYPKPGRQTDDEAEFDREADEPFTFGLLETVTIELGIPGLIAILFIFACWLGYAGGAFALAARVAQPAATLALASLGAGAGALVLSVFGNPLIRGVGGTFSFFFALAWLLSRLHAAGAPVAPAPEESA